MMRASIAATCQARYFSFCLRRLFPLVPFSLRKHSLFSFPSQAATSSTWRDNARIRLRIVEIQKMNALLSTDAKGQLFGDDESQGSGKLLSYLH